MLHGQALLEVIVAILFDKVLGEAYFSGLYSDLCVKISKEVADMFEQPTTSQPQPAAADDNKPQAQKKRSQFRTILLNLAQDSFSRGLEPVAKEGKSGDEVAELEMLQKRRMLGNIRFIGELYKKAMITEKIMHECVLHLLTDSEEDLEALCNLLTTIGKKLDQKKAEERMDAYFQKLELMVRGGKLSSRLRFMLLDLLDLRKNDWQPRVKKAEAKSKEQVRQESEAEAAAKAAVNNRGGQTPRGGQTITMLPRAGGAMSMPAAGGHSKQSSGGQDIRILTSGASLQQTISGGKGRPSMGAAASAPLLTPGGSARAASPSSQLMPSSSATGSLRPGGALRPQTKASLRGSDGTVSGAAAASTTTTSTPPSASPVDTSDTQLPRSSSTSQLGLFTPAEEYPSALDKTVESGWKEYTVGGDYNELINLVKDEAKGAEYMVMQHALNVVVNTFKHESVVREAVMRLYSESHLTREQLDRGVGRYLSLLTTDFITEECPAAPKRIAIMLAPFIEQGKVSISAITASLRHLVAEEQAGPVFAAVVTELEAHMLDKQSVLDLLEAASFSLATLYVDEDALRDELTGRSGEQLQQLFPLASCQTLLNDLLQRSFSPASAPSFSSHVDAVVSLLLPHSAAASSPVFVRSLYRSVLEAARQTDSGAEVEMDKLVSTFVAPLLSQLAAAAPLAAFAQSPDTLRGAHLSLLHSSYAYSVARASTALFLRLIGLLSRHSVLTAPAELLSEWRDAVSRQGWVADKDREAAFEAAVAALK